MADTVVLDVECGEKDAKILVVSPVLSRPWYELLMRQHEINQGDVLVAARASVDVVVSVFDAVDCPFRGDVDVSVSGRGPHARGIWVCPVCGADHEFAFSDLSP